jgi:hypothetical protein
MKGADSAGKLNEKLNLSVDFEPRQDKPVFDQDDKESPRRKQLL